MLRYFASGDVRERTSRFWGKPTRPDAAWSLCNIVSTRCFCKTISVIQTSISLRDFSALVRSLFSPESVTGILLTTPRNAAKFISRMWLNSCSLSWMTCRSCVSENSISSEILSCWRSFSDTAAWWALVFYIAAIVNARIFILNWSSSQ